jgi:hypothetical protein
MVLKRAAEEVAVADVAAAAAKLQAAAARAV